MPDALMEGFLDTFEAPLLVVREQYTMTGASATLCFDVYSLRGTERLLKNPL
jgi:hypothetical protein